MLDEPDLSESPPQNRLSCKNVIVSPFDMHPITDKTKGASLAPEKEPLLRN